MQNLLAQDGVLFRLPRPARVMSVRVTCTVHWMSDQERLSVMVRRLLRSKEMYVLKYRSGR